MKDRRREIMNKLSGKQFFVGVILVLGLVIIGIGGKIYMDNKRLKEEMIQVVNSEEAKKEIEAGLKNLDSKALTPEGKIKSYKIDYESIEHNPMGGIMFDIIINNDKALVADFDLNKYSEKLEVGGIGLSEKLSDMIREV